MFKWLWMLEGVVVRAGDHCDGRLFHKASFYFVFIPKCDLHEPTDVILWNYKISGCLIFYLVNVLNDLANPPFLQYVIFFSHYFILQVKCLVEYQRSPLK